MMQCSLAEIAKAEISRLSGTTASVAILISSSSRWPPWFSSREFAFRKRVGNFYYCGNDFPIALLMGVWMFRLRKAKLRRQQSGGVMLLTLAVIFGRYISNSPSFVVHVLTSFADILLALYGFCDLFTGMAAVIAARLFKLNNES